MLTRKAGLAEAGRRTLRSLWNQAQGYRPLEGSDLLDSTHRMRTASSALGGEPASAMVADPDWMTCLQEVCELLWPAPAMITVETSEARSGLARAFQRWAKDSEQAGDGEFTLVPGFRQPPLLVPTSRSAASVAVRHYNGPRSPTARLCVNVLSLALGRGLGGAVLRGRVRVTAPAGSETIEAYLRRVTSRDIRVSMYLGPARANRKPVLQLVTGSGETAGFAKVGINPLSRSLVRAERDALTLLSEAGLTEVSIPRVLHHGEWNGLDVLVLSALPAWQRRRPLPAARLAAAMCELARVGGLRQETLSGGDYLARLRSRLAAADDSADRAALLRMLDVLPAWADGATLTVGSWHGDWAPWNMANTSRGLMVWDWERFASGVPVGFDALHHWLQVEVSMAHRNARAAAARCVEEAPQLLAPFGIGARAARLTAVLYLADLATRYLADRQAQAGAPLGAPGVWLIPAVGEVIDPATWS